MTAVSPLRLLLWLKWTLTWRGYRRSRIKTVSAILSIVLLVPLSLLGAWAVEYWGTLRPWTPPLAARDCLAIVYLLWALTPLMGFNLNESFDLTKLFVYPLSYRQIFLGSVLGSALDLPVLATLPSFGMLLWLFSATPGVLPEAWVVNALILGLFLLHTLALGQAITLTLIGFLRSRRFRDITVVLLPLVGMGYYIGQRVFFSRLERGSLEDLLDGPFWRLMGWLPPGWAAKGLTAARDGDWVSALLWLGMLALACLAALAIAATALKGLYLGDRGPQVARTPAPALRGTPLRLGESTRGQEGRTGMGFSHVLRRLPPDIAAVAGKEMIYLIREPQYKAMAVNAVYTLVAIAVPILLPMASGSSRHTIGILGDWLLFAFSGTLLLALLPLLFNLWGGEGAAITVLFSFPTRRRALLLGKNFVHAGVLLTLNFTGLTLVAAITGRWHLWPLALVWTLLAAPVLLAAGNLVSIRLPHRMLVRGQRWARGGIASASGEGAGCAFGFLYLLSYAATGIVLLPALAAVLLPVIFHWSPLWYALTLPLAAAYSGALYLILLGQAEHWLLAREPEIAQRIVPAD